MKITHVCLCGPFSDGFSYQENLLPKYHKKLGHEVSIIASKWAWGNDGELIKVNNGYYTDEYGIPVKRLDIVYDKNVSYRFRKFKKLYHAIEEEQPDVLFVHGVAFLDIETIRKFVKKHKNTKLIIDNHADINNSAKSFLSKKILHGIVWKWHAQRIETYTSVFFGVLPARVDFLVDMYMLPKEKCKLLVMGADDEIVQYALQPEVREKKRGEYRIAADDIVIITGGKIDQNKPQILTLMKAVNQIQDERIKLLVFGSVAPELKSEFDIQLSEQVHYIGWKKSNEIYSEFAGADIVAFPGLHSVLWEQAVGMGKPSIFRKIEGFTHIDVGGNCMYFEEHTVESYKNILLSAILNVSQMELVAKQEGINKFSYRNIAKKSLGVE